MNEEEEEGQPRRDDEGSRDATENGGWLGCPCEATAGNSRPPLHLRRLGLGTLKLGPFLLVSLIFPLVTKAIRRRDPERHQSPLRL